MDRIREMDYAVAICLLLAASFVLGKVFWRSVRSNLPAQRAANRQKWENLGKRLFGPPKG